MLALCSVGAMAALPPISPANSIMCMNYDTTPTPITTTPPLAKPQDIAIDGIGDIFVVDSARAELIRVDAEDQSSTVLVGPDVLQIPVGLTISPVHADLFIGDSNTSTIWWLQCKTRNSNYCEQYYPTPLNISLQTSVHPQGLQMDGDEHLYIADFNGHRVLKRDSSTGTTSVILSAANMGDLAPANPFGPHDIAIDSSTHELLVTDITNDDIWSLKCAVASQSGNSCDQYVQ